MLKELRKKLLNPVLSKQQALDTKYEAILNNQNQKLDSLTNTINLLSKTISEELPSPLLEAISIPQITEKVNNVIYIIDNGNIQVINTSFGSVSYYWVVYSKANDPISEAARANTIPIEHNLFELFKTPGTFLDIGANIGAFCLPFCAMGWKGYAFEASSQNVDVLSKSIHLNGFDITIINEAVYDKTGSIYFGQGGPFGLVRNEMTTGITWEELSCICLDDWYKKNNPPEKVDFIKMDIEGSEVAALNGMKEMLKKYEFPPIFLEANSYTLFLQNETQRSLLMKANEMGYNAYVLKNNKLMKYDINYFPTVIVTDFLLLKDIPKNLNITPIETYIQTQDEVIEVILHGLTKFCDHNSNVDICFCYALKDFPEYSSIREIKTKLEEIYTKNVEDKFLNKYLGWFIQ